MADITMCEDHLCPYKEECYRYTAVVNKYRQSYFSKSPRIGKMCNEFWNNEMYNKRVNFDK